MSIFTWLNNVYILKSKFSFKIHPTKDLFVNKVHPLKMTGSIYFSALWHFLV